MGLLSRKNGHAESSSPVNGQSHERHPDSPLWKRAPVIVGVLVALASGGVAVYASGQAMERKASRVELEAAREALGGAMAKARESSDARLNALEREASGNAATLRAIDGRLKSIDEKLDIITYQRRNP